MRRLAHAKERGFGYMILTKRLSRSPKNWDRVKLAGGTPSLWARIVGDRGDHDYVIDVKVSDVERWLSGNGYRLIDPKQPADIGHWDANGSPCDS